MQKITSKDTSVNTLNRVYREIAEKHKEKLTILDYGCGKYSTNEEYAKANGFAWYGYDPYNRTEEENSVALKCNPDIIVCSNVLNVIEDNDSMLDVIKTISDMNVPVYYTIYEGNKSGVGNETTKGYQRNEKTSEYIGWLEMLYGTITKRNNIIYCCA